MARKQRRRVQRLDGRQDPAPEKGSTNSQAGENPLTIAIKKLYRFLNTRLGWPLAALLVAGVLAWQNWDKVTQAPGVREALTSLRELLPLPQANPERFSIAIARLENDKDDSHRRLIRDSLLDQFSKNEIEVLLFDRRISIGSSEKPQAAVREGHERAKSLLDRSNAQVVIWGEALHTNADAPMRLHWTTNSGVKLEKTSEKYQPVSGSYDLPQLFRSDLNGVLALLASSQAASFSEQDGKFVADRLKPFIERVRGLIASDLVSGARQASLQMVLGDALMTYGDQSGDNVALLEARKAYQEALSKFSRQNEPQQWAEIQCNLATILAMSGRREAGTIQLEQAVAIYQDVLSDYPRAQAPLDWATMQNNLGAMLLTIGEREGETAQLEKAVVVFQEALKEATRKRAPLEWATTQSNLGTALMALGERETGTARVEQAVTAYKLALTERARERVPLDWAATQNNLGDALLVLGDRGTGTALQEQAVAAFQEALKERTRERVPMKWASTQNSLGNAFIALGKRESGTAHLERAVSAHQEALKEYTREHAPLGWATTQNNLGTALALLGKRETGTMRLEQAVSAYQEALKVRTREYLPLKWAATQNNLGYVLLELGVREKKKKRLEQAAATFEAVLREFTRDEIPSSFDFAIHGLNAAKSALTTL
ncbi:tetratricopeptide repeat protein [Pseudomonas frederiksbergensis]|uniref:tetratricopeptide repeat protein n=1 Tax=Pseudomonas frederiksbergensis TaxID=104087 RepID=UPI003D1D44EA